MKISLPHPRAVAAIAAAVLGMAFETPVFAAFYNPALESWSSCTDTLCIDAPPQGPTGLDGSGGWGWDSAANTPVSSLTVGTPATFTVTVLQPSSLPLCGQSGSITLTYSSQDFDLSDTSSRPVTATTPFSRGGVAVFSYTGDFWCHTAQSDSFTFTPVNPTGTAPALVTATIKMSEPSQQQASSTYPVAIRVPYTRRHR